MQSFRLRSSSRMLQRQLFDAAGGRVAALPRSPAGVLALFRNCLIDGGTSNNRSVVRTGSGQHIARASIEAPSPFLPVHWFHPSLSFHSPTSSNPTTTGRGGDLLSVTAAGESSLAAFRSVVGGAMEALALWWIKRTFQPSIIRKRRKTGFLKRQKSVGGRRVLKRRAAKGRARLGGC